MLTNRLTEKRSSDIVRQHEFSRLRSSDKSALEELILHAWKPLFADLERSIKPEIYEVFVPDWKAEQMRSSNTVCESGDIYTIAAERDE